MRSGPVTKATRESAIEACAMMASSNTHDYPLAPASLLADAIDVHDAGAELARAAISVVWPYRASYATVRELWAEAEQLLVHGWNPGDPVEALNIDDSVHPMCRCAIDEGEAVEAEMSDEQFKTELGQLLEPTYSMPTVDDVD